MWETNETRKIFFLYVSVFAMETSTLKKKGREVFLFCEDYILYTNIKEHYRMSDFGSTIFIPARDNLRIKQDDREEVIRLCRDITSYSKKGIFSLHRTILEDELIKELAGYFNVLSDRLAKIQKNYPENMHLRGTISGAVEELIEFFTFAFYKYNFQLLRYDVFLKMIQILINGDDVEPIVQYLIKSELLPEAIEPHIDFIDLADYLMGIFDCTGEIMRMCILQLSQSTGDFELKATLNNYRFLQKLYDQYVLLTQHYLGISINRGVFDDSANLRGNISFTKKLQVFESSLKKIESTLLDILVSDKEII